MDDLTIDNILTDSEVEDLFVDNSQQETIQEDEIPNDSEKEETTTTEVNPEELFLDKPESVGSGDNKELEGTEPQEGGNTSPNVYSSIAKAFAEEGIFQDLNDEDISKVSNAEDFRDLIEKKLKSELDERQKRIDEALNVGIEPSEIKKYENTLSYIDNIKEQDIADESENGENLRKRLIFQDFVNRGYSNERALKEVLKSFNAGTDLDDAKEALKSNKEFFTEKYKELVNQAKEAERKEQEEQKKLSEALKKSILEGTHFGGIEIDKATRQKAFEAIDKPVHRDLGGNYYTAIQKYEMENKNEFLTNLALCFTLTDGFKNLDKLVRGKVKKEVSKGLKELENVIATPPMSSGSLRFASGSDPDAYIGKDWKLDI